MLKEEIIGKRVRLIRMEDPYTKLKSGDEGLVTGVDDLSQIMVKWDDGSSLSLIPDLDEYEILESRKIKMFLEFVNNQSSSYVDEKLGELEELVMSFSDGKDLMYEWKNEDDHNIIITYQINGDSFKYELDIDSGFLLKTENDKIVMEEVVEDVEEGLDMIETDIQSELGINENYNFIIEKNVAVDQSLWNSCKSWAKSKYDVWPSAYAVGAAAKRYKQKGGKWRKEKKRKKKK
jgi:hypothetical protein